MGQAKQAIRRTSNVQWSYVCNPKFNDSSATSTHASYCSMLWIYPCSCLLPTLLLQSNTYTNPKSPDLSSIPGAAQREHGWPCMENNCTVSLTLSTLFFAAPADSRASSGSSAAAMQPLAGGRAAASSHNRAPHITSGQADSGPSGLTKFLHYLFFAAPGGSSGSNAAGHARGEAGPTLEAPLRRAARIARRRAISNQASSGTVQARPGENNSAGHP